MTAFLIQTYRGTANGWQLAGSANQHTYQRAEHLLSLHRRIDPDRFVYRIAATAVGAN
jgi:hypothetical protein